MAVPSIVWLSVTEVELNNLYIVYASFLLTHLLCWLIHCFSSSLACLIPAHPSQPHSHPNSPIPSPLSSPLSSQPAVLSLLTYLIPALIPAHLSHPHSHPHPLSHPCSPISSQLAYFIPTLVPTHCLILNWTWIDGYDLWVEGEAKVRWNWHVWLCG